MPETCRPELRLKLRPDPRAERRHQRKLSRRCDTLTACWRESRADPDLAWFVRLASESVQERTGTAVAEPELLDQLAQTLVHTRLAWQLHPAAWHAVVAHPKLLPPAESLPGMILRWTSPWEIPPTPQLARTTPITMFGDVTPGAAASGGDFDEFLGTHDPRGRSRHGVFFTPGPLADFVVAQTDRMLRSEFGLADGLADRASWRTVVPGHPDPRPFLSILDPAAGTGVFLLSATRQVHRTLQARWQREGLTPAERRDAWNAFVTDHWWRQIAGRELLLPAFSVAWIRWVDLFAELGFEFTDERPVPWHWGNSFLRSHPGEQSGPWNVLLGNPPFSALTTAQPQWILDLLREPRLGAPRPDAGDVGHFYEVDGAPLGEKKLWLHDDYVQFLRHAQWLVEQAGAGLVAYVTNHGYLDNLTFRGMRRSLQRSFPRIEVLDLHGGRKKREIPPIGIVDENLFGIDQGVAVSWLRKPPKELPPQTARADLWGTREEKLAWLSNQAADPAASVPWSLLEPIPPHYSLDLPRGTPELLREFQGGYPLPDILPIHSSAAVTARDAFVVGFTREEVLHRLAEFTSVSRDDDWLRDTYFQHTRSRRYPRGDSRGWKLSEARRLARAESVPESLARRCSYRPFDTRWILWADYLVDWPRSQIMRHLIEIDNVALVTRRQFPPAQPADYFHVADSIVIDGLIRSDNRGSETFFPLFLADGGRAASGDEPECNLSAEFRAACARGIGSAVPPKPLECFAMIYAQLHSRGYRRRYQSELTSEFPRVQIPKSADLFQRLVELGRRLLQAHLMRPGPAGPGQTVTQFLGPSFDAPPATESARSSLAPIVQSESPSTLPLRGWPRWEDGKIWLTPDRFISITDPRVWEHPVGSYQVGRKWLRDRAGRIWDDATSRQYQRVLDAIATSKSIEDQIEIAIEGAGGWPGAFRRAGSPC